jgi:PHP family Zn ribbon phosphoesterase
MRYFYDLHIHSCLSPCASPDMTPSNIARMAVLAGYDIIAVSDHNTTGNCRSVLKAAATEGITAVPAMELTTSEEVHVLCLLPDPEAADAFGAFVRSRLPDIRNRPDIFGEQTLMDEDDTVLGTEERLLLNACSISINEAAALVRSFGGAAVPAHIDRSSFSVLSNLGFLDRSLGFPAVEITRGCDRERFTAEHPELRGLPYIINSDAHYLSDMPDRVHSIELAHPSPKEVIKKINEGVIGNVF